MLILKIQRQKIRCLLTGKNVQNGEGLCSVVELRTGDGLTMEQSWPESIFSTYYMLDVTLNSLKAYSNNHFQKPMKYVILNYFQNEMFQRNVLKNQKASCGIWIPFKAACILSTFF